MPSYPSDAAWQPTLDDEQLFDAALRTKARHLHRVNVALLKTNEQKFLRDLRGRGTILLNRLPKPPTDSSKRRRISFDLVDSTQFNAFAALQAEQYVIGVNHGTIKRLYEVAYALLSTPELFPDIGKCATEAATLGQAAAVVFGAPAARSEFDIVSAEPFSASYANLVPLDVDRQWFAHEIASLALQFLFYHEFYHIWGGHLDFMQLQGLMPLRWENVSEIPDDLPPQQSQLLEHDADKRAVWRMPIEIFGDGLLLNAVVKNNSTPEHKCRGWSLMCATMFILLDDNGDDVEVARSHSHPHPEVRFWAAHDYFKQSLGQSGGSIPFDYDAIAEEVFQTISRLWASSGREGAYFQQTRSHVDSVIGEHHRLSSSLQALYPRLLPFDADQMTDERRRDELIFNP